MLSESKTVCEKRSPEKINLIWHLEGLDVANSDYTSTFCYGETVKLPSVSKRGRRFIGWYLDPEFKTPITKKNIMTANEDLELYPLLAPLVNFTIADISIDRFSIVIAENAPADTRYNAEQLQKFIKKRTGHTIPVITDSTPAGAH